MVPWHRTQILAWMDEEDQTGYGTIKTIKLHLMIEDDIEYDDIDGGG